MTERIDHSSKAVKMLALNADFLSQEGDEIHALGNTLEALVHATLALVEQQRIANLMDYLRILGSRPGVDDDRQIREGLGL